MDKLGLMDLLIPELGISQEQVTAYRKQKEVRALEERQNMIVQAKACLKPIEISDDDIFLSIKKIIMNQEVNKNEVTPLTRITADPHFDNFDRMVMMMQFEKEFGICIPDDAEDRFILIQDTWKYISEKIRC